MDDEKSKKSSRCIIGLLKVVKEEKKMRAIYKMLNSNRTHPFASNYAKEREYRRWLMEEMKDTAFKNKDEK